MVAIYYSIKIQLNCNLVITCNFKEIPTLLAQIENERFIHSLASFLLTHVITLLNECLSTFTLMFGPIILPFLNFQDLQSAATVSYRLCNQTFKGGEALCNDSGVYWCPQKAVIPF